MAAQVVCIRIAMVAVLLSLAGVLHLRGGPVKVKAAREAGHLRGRQAEGVKRDGDYEGLMQAFEAARYRIEPGGGAVKHAWNAAQELHVEFGLEGLRPRHRRGSLLMRLSAYGWGERLGKPGPARLVAEANRIEYRCGELVEWYLNERRKLQQGFELPRRPGGAVGPLVLVLETEGDGDLEPPANPAADSVVFFRGGQPVLGYSG